MTQDTIDHLVYACANLERGMDEIEAQLGTRPVRGGRHPKFGTHNALLGLGDGVYLEIASRDPDPRRRLARSLGDGSIPGKPDLRPVHDR